MLTSPPIVAGELSSERPELIEPIEPDSDELRGRPKNVEDRRLFPW